MSVLKGLIGDLRSQAGAAPVKGVAPAVPRSSPQVDLVEEAPAVESQPEHCPAWYDNHIILREVGERRVVAPGCCDRCGGSKFRDIPITGGRVRRDCVCGRFLDFVRW